MNKLGGRGGEKWQNFMTLLVSKPGRSRVSGQDPGAWGEGRHKRAEGAQLWSREVEPRGSKGELAQFRGFLQQTPQQGK